MTDLQGKVAVVTGGAKGLGLAVVLQLLSKGARVALVDADREALDKLASDHRSDDVLKINADVSRREDVSRYVQETLERFGRIDMFHNNAGVAGRQVGFLDFEETDFQQVFSVNVLGAMLGLQAVGRVMKEQRSGSIVNTASVSGFRTTRPNAGIGMYGASKAAVIRMGQEAAHEFATYGVRVNSICPGPISTPLLRSTFESSDRTSDQVDELVRQHYSRQPFGRAATADEVANVVLWLFGSTSTFVSGGIYTVDGALTA